MTFDPAPVAPTSIVIVDDEESVRTGLRRLCTALGLHAVAHGSGSEFVKSLEAGAAPPDCVLLDAQMPHMNGLELHLRLLDLGLRIPTIVYTGDDAPEVKARYLEAGVAAYLRKPIAGDALVAAIERVMTWYRPVLTDERSATDPSSRS